MSILTTALAAAVVAILATVAVERLGGRFGGVIATLPTTILPASWGFAAAVQHTPTEALAAVPLGMLVDAGFLYCWRLAPPHLPAWSMPRRLGVMIGISLAVWFGLAAGALALVEVLALPPLLVGLTAMLAHLLLGLYTTLHPFPAPRGEQPVSALAILARGTLAGLAIAIAVAFARSGMPLVAGVASVFPAIFLTTMVALWWSQGEAVPLGAVGPIIMGSTAVSAYALISIWSFVRLGVIAGTTTAWFGAVLLCSVPTAWWLARPTRG